STSPRRGALISGTETAYSRYRLLLIAGTKPGDRWYRERLLLIEYEDIVSGQGMLNKDVIEKHDKRGGIAFEPGDVLYGKLRPYLQNWLNPQFKGIALGDFWVLNPTDISSGFLFVLIRTPTFERVANESTGTKMPRADWQNVSNTEFSIPLRKEEQEAIGALFQKLDSLIALHQRERAGV
ncbi:restriction endonuclease subunit S, partial [Adlercreutzia rubneri]